MTPRPRIYFLLPLYNESPNIEMLSQNLLTVLPDHERVYVFSDDASTDDSIAKVKKHFPEDSLRIVTTPKNGGPGSAFNRGFEHILDNENPRDCDVVVTLEADNTSDLTILPAMLTINRLGYELVLASVYAQGGGLDKTSLFRRILSYGANFLFRFLFEVSVLTLSSFYRIYSVSLLRRIQGRYETLVQETGFICALELLLKSLNCGSKVIEVPMLLRSQLRKGESKMRVAKTTLAYLAFLHKWKKKQSLP